MMGRTRVRGLKWVSWWIRAGIQPKKQCVACDNLNLWARSKIGRILAANFAAFKKVVHLKLHCKSMGPLFRMPQIFFYPSPLSNSKVVLSSFKNSGGYKVISYTKSKSVYIFYISEYVFCVPCKNIDQDIFLRGLHYITHAPTKDGVACWRWGGCCRRQKHSQSLTLTTFF